MSLAATAAPLMAYAIVFQTLVYMSLPARMRTRFAPVVTGTVGATVALCAGLLFGFESVGLVGGSAVVAVSTGVATVALLSVVGAALLSNPSVRPRLADPRLAVMDGRQAATHIFIRIPVFTALIEEAFFRGVLHAALVALYPLEIAALIGAISFGLWHVGPGIDQSRVTSPMARRPAGSHAALTVLVTTIAGLFLVWLRIETGSIWAPVAVHAGVNMTMAVVARQAPRDGLGWAPDSLPGWKRISEACSFAWRER